MGFNSGFKGLNAELNPSCHLLALLGVHHILHVSRIRVNWDEIPAVNVQHDFDFIYSILCCLAVPHFMLSQGMTVPQL